METSGDADWEQVGPLLRPGEQLLWSGRPDPSRLMTKVDLFLIPFSLAWGGFAIFWETSALRSGAPIFMALFGLVFVTIGLHLIAGRLVVKRYQKSKTRYVITSRRGLILRASGSVQDTPLQDQPLSIDRSRDGRWATVTVGRVAATSFAGRGGNYGNTGMEIFSTGQTPFSFYDVGEPKAVLAALETARRGGPQDSPPR